MGLDLDVSRGDEGDRDCGDDEPEGEGEEGLLVREHVEEGGEPGVELVEGPDGGLLAPRVVDPSPKAVHLRVGVPVV